MTVHLAHPPGNGLAAVPARWSDRPVLVVGDVILDEWCYGEADRLCREAPAPVLRPQQRIWAAGGAGNTAVNLAALGARATLVGPVGDDRAGANLHEPLAGRRGLTNRLVTVAGRPTPRKRRLLAGDQLLLREDHGTAPGPLPPAAAQAVIEALAAVVEEWRAAARAGAGPAPVLVVCDYGLGGLPEEVRGWLLAHRDEFAMVALDAHELRPWRGLAPTLVTPSLAEAARALGWPEGEGAADRPDGEGAADRLDTAGRYADALRDLTGAAVVAVTLDQDGALVTGRDGARCRTQAEPAPASHSVGAGDAYLAAATLALAAGAALPDAAALAQRAAQLGVADSGTSVCDLAGLHRSLLTPTDEESALVDEPGLVALVRRCRDWGGRVVFTNGCFDVLHRGHVAYLRQARQLGDLLVVAVNGDDSVRRLKGTGRPVNPIEDRVTVLAELSIVDAVVVFDEDSPAQLIELVRPDLYVKGGDYPPELVPEAPLVRRLGGDVRTLSYVPDRSTSAIISRIRSRERSRPSRTGGGT